MRTVDTIRLLREEQRREQAEREERERRTAAK
jgi:hypothetical protein